jgi:DMSO reductase anchor subunit
MHVAGCDAKSSRIGWALIAVSATAAAALFAVYVLQMGALSQVSNYLYSVRDIAPEYGWLLVAYAILAVAALVVHVLSFRNNVGHPFAFRVASSILMLLALFAMRFAFYLLHLTVGLGV